METPVRELLERSPEEVIPLRYDPANLTGWIVIDSTKHGPALGGIRYRVYPDEHHALEDARSLARMMTWKTVLAELPCGGGKIVLLAHEKFNRPLAFRWLGEFLERLQGRYHAGPDMGVTAEDLAYVRSATAYIAHGYGGPTDYGEWTALGVFHALTAAVEHRAGEPAPWPELRVVVQGLGQVGWSICRRLWEVGAQLVVTDIDAERVRRARETFGAGVVQPDEILFCDADVLVPCAAGQIIDPAAAAALRCWLVCGSANGILTHPDVALLLHERGILMVPDILSSAGAVIAGALRFFTQADDESVAHEVGRIALRTRNILAQASETGQPPLWVALDRVAHRL